MRVKKFLIDFYDYLFEAPIEATAEISGSPAPQLQAESKAKSKDKDNAVVFTGSRFEVEFPGIPSYLFMSYKYLGTDVKVDNKWWHFNKKTIKDDYSIVKISLASTDKLDICEKLKELELNPYVGDIKIRLLDKSGKVVKTIEIPESQVVEIIAFRELDHELNEGLTGDIVVKHKQRKFN